MEWRVRDKPWALSGALATLGVLTQIHFAAIALAPIVAIPALWAAVKRLRGGNGRPFWRPLLAGIGAILILYLPYILFDALTGWSNVRAALDMVRAPSQVHWETVRYALLNVGGREIHALAGPARYRQFLERIWDLSYWPDRIEEAAAVLSAGYVAWRWLGRRSRQDGLLTLWLLSPVLFFLRSSSPVYPHYLIPLYPAPYLGIAIAAWDALHARRLRGLSRYALYGASSLLLLATVAWQGYLSVSIHAFVDEHETPGGMGTPVRILRQVVRAAGEIAEQWDNPDVVMVCPGDDPRWDECPAVFDFMAGHALDLRFVDGRSSLLFPENAKDALLILAPNGDAAREALGDLDGIARVGRIALREETDTFDLMRIPGSFVLTSPGDPARLQNGVTLLAYDVEPELAPGHAALLRLYWRIDALPPSPPAQGYSFANHILDADGQRIAQQDGPGHPAQLWRVGDQIVSWFELALNADAPSGPYRLKVSMYVYTPPDQFVSIPVLDAAGNPVAQAVEWPVPPTAGDRP
jgi:hypothetical protein